MPNVDKKFPRKYLSPSFDASNAADVTRLYDELLARAVASRDDLEKFIFDWEELGGAIHDRYSRAHVASTVDTTDEKAEKAYMQLVEQVLPLTETYGFKLNKKMLETPAAGQLGEFYACHLRTARKDVEIFREENVPLGVQERKLVNEFEKIMGGLTAKFRGKELTMQQLARFLEEPDGATRREAYEARVAVRSRVAGELDALYDRMLEVRRKIAANAGFKSFRDYTFASMHRFDYAPEDCFKFHDAIERHVVPVVSRFHDARMKKLGVPTLRPWDLQVDPESKTPITPFSTAGELVEGCRKIFRQVDAELGEYFDHMISKKLLDLDSRKGKAPGGYCTSFSEERVPFIFMNAAGTKRDVDTLLHEGGHSFHYYLSREIPLTSYHHTGLEFAEVASMAMELLSRPYFKEFYAKDVLPRVLDDQLKKVVEFFPFMAMIDAFQHWVYTAPPDATGAQARRSMWSELERRFQPKLDWSGLEGYRDLGWQYPHVFAVPFYYVEYGIAQLGALAVWKQSLDDHHAAVERYKSGLRLGGSKPLPELFSAVGARFGMSGEIIAPLVQAVEKNLSR
ncbi:MAG: M3 family oligoendopeptidase [Deltaproteobacteria bacterium]|nr:M3 family oligoendopeptidase [Deltaproteobacteria bacterium]